MTASSERFAVSSRKPGKTRWLEELLLCLLLTGFLLPNAEAQQSEKVHRIGLLMSASPAATAPWIDAFRQALRDLGYIEGKNLVLEIRGDKTQSDQISDLAAELVRLKVDIIVAGGSFAVRAAIKATSTIPIVMRTATDPVRAGFVPSLARPGGNITGVTSVTTKLIGKHLELLAEVFPGVKHVAVLTAQADRARFMATSSYKEMEAAARALGVKLQTLTARDSDMIDKAFVAMTKERAQALLVTPNPRYVQHGERIISNAAAYRLPAIYYQTIFVENGGLMSYATNNADEYRRAAVYVDKILKGAKPADLPIEQPTKFEFAINLKTAKQIGLAIPPSVLARADKVIK
jgi:putative ABC transport system substrate-binding protein